MKAEILKVMRNEPDFVSGQSLCELFGVSRTAIWKVITQLKEEGYEIESVPNRGYRLQVVPDIITKAEVTSQLRTNKLGRTLYVYDSVDSTNIEAKRLATDGAVEGTVVIARKQIKGKGRRGKAWLSNEDTGVWMSLVLRPSIQPRDLPVLTLIAGLAALRAINDLTHLEAFIKWPNDIVINSKKVCGILTELSAEMDYVNYIVIGTGINVNTSDFPEELQGMATSLKKEGKVNYNRGEIAACYLNHLEVLYNVFEQEGFAGVKEEFCKRCINLDKEVIAYQDNAELIGRATDITDKGELVIIDAYGQKHIIQAGEVSVRGLYGYA